MTSRTAGSRLWRARRAAVLVLALISAVILILSVSDGRRASADTPPQVDPWAWGRNSQGQLGDGTNDNNGHPNPVQVSNLTDVVTMAGGGLHSLAIKSDGTDDTTANDGTLYAWGNNFQGQLGDGTSGSGTNKNTPVQAIDTKGTTDTSDDGPLGDVVAVAAGSNHSLAIKSDGTDVDSNPNDGTVYAWGSDSHGQLGDGGTNTSSNVPVKVIDTKGTTDTSDDGPLEDVVAVAGGTFHSLALKSDGTAWAWGTNDVGQLGNGESGSGNMSITPVQVEDPTDPSSFLQGIVAVAAGSNHSLAVKSDGTVWAWGFNSQGMLGYDPDPATTTLEPSSTPGQTSSLTDATAVAGGNFHSIALKSNGTVWAWGANNLGQLGHDPNPATPGFEGGITPGQVKDHKNPNDPNDDVALTNVEDVSSGLNHNLAATSTPGAVWAWGCNDFGQLGNSGVPMGGLNCASPAFSRTPVQTIGLFNAADVAGGGSHSLALANVDNTAPATTATPSPPPNAAGWNNSDVTVTLNATDTGGSDVKEIVYAANGDNPIASTTASGTTTSVTITTEVETTITYHAADNAGNVEAPEKTLTIKLDKSAPEVDSVAPTPGQQSVGRRTNVTATFLEEMDRATLKPRTFKLFNTATKKRVPAAVSCNDPCLTATLNPFPTDPLARLAKSTRYKAIITTGAKDRAGNALAQNEVWFFTTI